MLKDSDKKLEYLKSLDNVEISGIDMGDLRIFVNGFFLSGWEMVVVLK